MKKWIAVLMTAVMLALTGSFAVMAEDETEGENGGTVTVTAPSVLLMEASSGKVLFERCRYKASSGKCDESNDNSSDL